MATPSLPEVVAVRLDAALRFSNEAEQLVSLGYPQAAVIIAGAVLDFVLEGGSVENLGNGDAVMTEQRELRDRALHPGTVPLTVDQASAMIRDVRGMIERSALRPGCEGPSPGAAVQADQIRGKYKFVPTSSASFIERKRDELKIEHQ